MLDIIGMVKALFGFGTAGLQYQTKKLDLKNTEKVQKAASAQQEQESITATENAIERKDVDAVRREISE